MWYFSFRSRRNGSGFSGSSTAEEVTRGINGTGLTAIVTGIFAPPFTLSQDNVELQFATNYLGHFLLTNLLLDTMQNTVLKSGIEGRIVNISSMAHQFTYHEGILFDKLNDPSRYSKYIAYCQSKLAKILHANELARQFKDDGVKITANSVHPGIVKTNIVQLSKNVDRIIPHRFLNFLFVKDTPQGAATTCYVALHPQVKGVSGEYFSNCNLSRPSKQAQDVTMARKLFDFSMDLVK